MPRKPGPKKTKKVLGSKTLKKTRGGATKTPSGRASFALPEVSDEVIVAFESGDFKQPIVIGSLWNKDSPPTDSKK